MNTWLCTGNLTRDPEIRNVGDKKVCNFSIAVQEGYGEYKKVIYPRIAVWNNAADLVMKLCHKGSKVLVRGPINIREYSSNDGIKHSILEVFADKFELLGNTRSSDAENTSSRASETQSDDVNVSAISNEDTSDGLPF